MEYYHGVELETKFLDDLWLSVLTKVPNDKWIPITKNHDNVVAGIKHFIDCDCFGHNIGLTFDSKYTKFRKHEYKERVEEKAG